MRADKFGYWHRNLQNIKNQEVGFYKGDQLKTLTNIIYFWRHVPLPTENPECQIAFVCVKKWGQNLQNTVNREVL